MKVNRSSRTSKRARDENLHSKSQVSGKATKPDTKKKVPDTKKKVPDTKKKAAKSTPTRSSVRTGVFCKFVLWR